LGDSSGGFGRIQGAVREKKWRYRGNKFSPPASSTKARQNELAYSDRRSQGCFLFQPSVNARGRVAELNNYA
jgi:hypothetical protein